MNGISYVWLNYRISERLSIIFSLHEEMILQFFDTKMSNLR